MKKPKLNKRFLFFAATAVFIFSCSAFFRGFLNHTVVSCLERRYKAKLFIGNIKGNILTNIRLENILVENVEGLPPQLQVKAESVDFQYTLADLVRRSPKIEASGLQIRMGQIELPFKFSQQQDVITLLCDKRLFYLNQLEQLFSPKDALILKGLCEIKGVLTLERLKLRSFEAQFACDDLEMISSRTGKAKLKAVLSLKGEQGIARLTGSILVKKAEYYGDPQGFDPVMPLPGIFDKALIDITVKGKGIKVKNKVFDALVNADLKLKKAPSKNPYLAGKFDTVKGTYFAYQNKFKIKRGVVSFEDKSDAPAIMDVVVQTKVSGYTIFATSKGTFKSSRLELSSEPDLAPDEIAALLLFGKKVADLETFQRDRLSGMQNMADFLLSKIFLGKAEAKIADITGLDNITVQPAMGPEPQKLSMPSVEFGKYLSDKMYATYKRQAGQSLASGPVQSAGGEYRLSENIRLKGERSFIESIKLPQNNKIAVEFQWKF
ncbi:MAG: translocation/assembly module TamB domain-containing protein [Candidatus Omnitrophica bacterium]|nr:translocation/assembly module TamB domain-containing protein [Candidatus Omnitrophota bacterium]